MQLPPLLRALPFLLLAGAVVAEDLPPTLLTTRGKEIYREDFTKPLPPSPGKPVRFASGFAGWVVHGGKWAIVDGTYRGSEEAEMHHPATSSYGFDFQDIIVQCDMRLEDVPLEGRPSRYMEIKATDEKDYICALVVHQGGLRASIFDDTRIDPKSGQRTHEAVARIPLPVKLGEWHTVVLEIKGDEAVGTLDNKSVTFTSPLLGNAKHSIMLVAASEGSFRRFRIWEALSNPDWPKHKEALSAASTTAKP